MKIAVLGYGTVGKNICKYIEGNSKDIQIKYILRRPGKATEPFMTDNYGEILDDKEVEVVVEALSGWMNPYELMKQALLAGKHVVSANKAALAYGFKELVEIASRHNVLLKYEASSGGTIPIVSEIISTTNTNFLSRLYGIMNGTSNFILDKMINGDMEYLEALNEAKSLGYTEADPSADLDGTDVKNKLIILTSTAYQGFVTSDFPVVGIGKLTRKILDDARLEGKVIKLMGISARSDNYYALGVVPCLIDQDMLEAHVSLNYNMITIVGDMCNDLKFYGQGAGGKPTADALLRDVYAIKDSADKNAMNRFFRKLNYVPDMLKGSAMIAGKRYKGTLEQLVALAHEQDEFIAFRWEGME